MEKIRFDIRVFAITLLIFFGFSVLYIRALEMPEYTYQSTGIIRGDIYDIKDYEIEDNHFTPLSIDPKIFFHTDHYEDVCGIRVLFESDSIPEKIQVYYAGEYGAFSEENSACAIVKGRSEVDVVFHKSNIDNIIDITLDINEEFTLKNIEVLSNQVMVDVNHTKDYVIFFAVAFAFAMVMSLVPGVSRMAARLENKIKKVARFAVKNKKKLVIYAAILALWAVVSILIIYMAKVICDYDYLKKYEAVMIFVGGAIVIFAYALRDITATKPQYLFFIVVFLMGSLNILTSPKTVGISWDDETHYGRTVYFSYGANKEIPYSDNEIVYKYIEVVENFQYYYSKEGRERWLELINSYKSEDFLVDTDDYTISTAYVSNIAPAAGLIIGRGLGFSYSTTYMLGRFMNLLQYSILYFIAISLIKGRGKYMLSVFGLIPTSVFLASSYSYDGWVIAFSVLAYAMLIAELQKENSCITMKKWISIMAVFAIGVLPKAIYFPMLFPMLFIGRKKFDKKYKFSIYAWINIIAMLLLVASFIIPMFTRGAGLNDTRVFSGVNSIEQIKYIIRHPLQYTGVLLKFISKYLSPDMSKNYLTYLGYYGYTSNYVAIFLSIG
ncbi:MAG: DUF2142 domain-containing protein, partial [Lachnospiraceae bacterium]|nr:DUF2142 domain-containing protein [Lachnospiraceae bacterium]